MMSFENPPKLESYYGKEDPDEHVEHVINKLDYYHAHGVAKCKFFSLTLKEGVMIWFITLLKESIDSWKEVCDSLPTQFLPPKSDNPPPWSYSTGSCKRQKRPYKSTLNDSPR